MEEKIDNFTCNKCNRNLKLDRNYYQSKDNFMCHLEIIPICKPCLANIFDIQKAQFGEKTAMRAILRRVDLPYMESIVERSLKAKNPVGHMFKEYNSYGKYNTLTYDNSESFPNFSGEDGFDEKGMPIDDSDLTSDDRMRWEGYGLTIRQMLYCKNMYNELIDKYELDSINDLLSVEQYAVTTVKMQEAFQKGSATDIERYRKTISSIESDLAIQSKQLKDSMDKDSWGLFIKYIENNEPIDEAEPREEFKDVDGIWNIVKKYIVGYLPVMLGVQKPQDVLGEDIDILDRN